MEKTAPAELEPENSESTGEVPIERDNEDIGFAEMAPWLELFCWSVLAWVPWLYWINGPAVTDDQAVVQTIMIITALVGAVSLRIRAIRLKRKSRHAAGDDARGVGNGSLGSSEATSNSGAAS